MSAISIREFSPNPSAIFARVGRGGTLQVTCHGNVIAI
ncbi:type II toxin-antitoxin system Phd/YefM family antitoxin [Streptomyces prunicolor]|nr:type II toxin-antitoxin system Phd/YefM family antitoxin [Streptomyces prunicolor]